MLPRLARTVRSPGYHCLTTIPNTHRAPAYFSSFLTKAQVLAIPGGHQLDSYSLFLKAPIHWSETGGSRAHVHHEQYLRYAEVGRLACFQRIATTLNLKNGLFNDEQVGPILPFTQLDIFHPLSFPDSLVIAMKHNALSRDSFEHEYALFSVKQKRIAALVRARLVMYSYKLFVRAPIPEEWRLEMMRFEAETGNSLREA